MMMFLAFVMNAILCSAYASQCDTFIIANAIIVAAILIQVPKPAKPTQRRHR